MSPLNRFSISSAVLFGLLFSAAITRAQWPQAAGPNHDYQVAGTAAEKFSVTLDQNVLWRSPLPNTGESTPVIAGGRVFVTCHTPMKADAEPGCEIFGVCFDAQTGHQLWRRELPATRVTDMASGFSDNTAASPVTDGTHVCFVNVGGSIRTFDFDGNLVWKYDWVPFGRHHARQQEPILHGGNVIVLKTVADDLTTEATTKSGAKPLGRDQKYWTRLHAFDLATGEISWVGESATSVHSASLLNRTPDGTPAILTGRGGGHQPPETPYGVSLIHANSGKTIWDLEIKGYNAHENAVWRGGRGGTFVGMNHHIIDIASGQIEPAVSLTKNVTVRRNVNGRYVSQSNATLPNPKRSRPITYHTNLLVGDFHYFRTHTNFLLGRVNVVTGKVEYLQVPAQVIRKKQSEESVLTLGQQPETKETISWDVAFENDVKNNDGFIVCQDKRAKLSGWGHVSAASPIVVGDLLYMPTMTGMVYVVRWNASELDESALVSISDLGPAGETWTLSSLAYSDGKLYARTLKELICIGD